MNLKIKNLRLSIIVILIVAMVSIIEAQCPMCRMSAESNLKAGGTEGSALNKGILYLLSLPYLAIMIIGITWYKNRKKFENQKEEEV